MARMKILDWVAFGLVTVGAVNWGLIAINPTWNLVSLVTMNLTWLERSIYGFVGVAGIYSVWTGIKLATK